jgi:hypothetical protein
MRPFKHLAALALLLLMVSSAAADVPMPNRRKPAREEAIRRDLPYARMTIEPVQGLREARLQVPRAQLGLIAGAAGLEEDHAQGAQAGAFESAGTVVAGLFLSLAVVLTGFLLLRTRRRFAGARTAALLVCACVLAAGGAAAVAYANIAPPIGFRAQDPGTLVRAAAGGSLAGSIRIEVVEGGGEIKLLIPAKPQKGGRGEEEE